MLETGSREKIEYQVNQLQKRLNNGCYSEEWLDLYLKKAKQIGLKEVGIVDHLYRFKETKAYFEKASESGSRLIQLAICNRIG